MASRGSSRWKRALPWLSGSCSVAAHARRPWWTQRQGSARGLLCGSPDVPSFLLQEVVAKQGADGKHCDIVKRVLSSRQTLAAAYNRLRAMSGEGSAVDGDGVAFLECIASEVRCGTFDVRSNCCYFPPGNELEPPLVLPTLRLKVVQMAIRMVLEIIYEPKFLPASHGCRPGKGRHTLLKEIRYAFPAPCSFIPMRLYKRFDSENMKQLVSLLQEEIQDSGFFRLLWQMFDADVLHLEVGGYCKGCGLAQEGILSSILINIYMDRLDRKVIAIRQNMKQEHTSYQRVTESSSSLELSFSMHFFRYVDEILVAVTCPEKLMRHVKDQIASFLTTDLLIQVDILKTDSLNEISHNMNIFGLEIWSVPLFETARPGSKEAIEFSEKTKNYLKEFSLRNQAHWEAGLRKMGAQILIHAFERSKHSKLKRGQLRDQYVKSVFAAWVKSVPSNIMQKAEPNLCPGKPSKEDLVLDYLVCKFLPQDLTHAYLNFQAKVKEYTISESDASLLQCKGETSLSAKVKLDRNFSTKLLAPIGKIMRMLCRIGLITEKGNPQPLLALASEDDIHIIQWYGCLAKRWLAFFSCCDNFSKVKAVVNYHVRWSCIQTLAVKHKVNDIDLARKLTLDLVMQGANGLIENAFPSESEVSCFRKTFLIDPSPADSLLNAAFVRMRDKGKACNVLTCKETITNYYCIQLLTVEKSAYCSAALHSAFVGKRLSICNKHFEGLNSGVITLQALDLNH